MIEKINVNQAIADVKACLFEFQNQICHMLQTAEPKLECVEDEWQYEQGGGGCSRAFVGASIIEKAGANFSHVHGAALPPAATAKRPELVDCKFQALGVSTVTHPYNPFVPTSHANVRFFVAEKPNADPIWWFGGGFDLTPFYGFAEDAALWHQHAQAACAPFGAEVYSKYKEWCDNYFYLPHRQEPRGVGGLFFDDLNEWGFAQCFAFMQSVAKHYLLAYQEILTKRHATPYTEQHRDFQCYRRGRYVEFNLLYDRGTLFGIQSNGRTESILMSLPPLVKWKYNWVPESGSEEEKLYREFLIRKEWV